MRNEKGGLEYHKQLVCFAILILFFLICSARQFIALDHEGPIESMPAYVVSAQGEFVNSGIYFFSNPPTLVEILTTAGITRDSTQIITSQTNTIPPNGSSLLLQKKSQGIIIKNLALGGKVKILLGIPINLNTATVEDLSSLPGIGPGIAGKIINFRNTHGEFTKLDDLKMVKGIGPKRFTRAKKYLKVESEVFISTQHLFRKEALRG